MSTVVKLQTPWQKVSGDPDKYAPLLLMQVGALLAVGFGDKMDDDQTADAFRLVDQIQGSNPALSALPARERDELEEIAFEYISSSPFVIWDLLDNMRQELAE